MTWTSSLSLTKGVSLIGPGRDSLTITRTGAMITIRPDATVLSNNEVIKVSGFTFDGGNSASQFIRVENSSFTTPFRKLMIGDNRFQNSSTSSSSAGVVWIQGQIRGVVYNNIFTNVDIVTQAEGQDDMREWVGTDYLGSSPFLPFYYGSSDNLYYENNLMNFTDRRSYTDYALIYTAQAGRAVYRYNTWTFPVGGFAGQTGLWDTHGFQNFPTGGNLHSGGGIGSMVVEYYGNTVTDNQGFQLLNHRGSWGLTFNNIFSGRSGAAIQIDQYAAGDSGGSGCNADDGLSTLGIDGQVNNTYTFNNTNNGTLINMTRGAIGDGCGTAQNLSWFNYNASCTSSACPAGIGRGTTAPTGTCTTGVGYWVANPATPTVSPSVIQSGTFYKCTSTNTWTAYYIPYTYPHPLRSDVSTFPAAPGGLTILGE